MSQASFCRFHGVPAEERLHWRSFLVKLGADNLRSVKNEELLVACHKYVYSSLLSMQMQCNIQFVYINKFSFISGLKWIMGFASLKAIL